MAILTDIFVAEREINHEEHERLIAEIAEFESALQKLSYAQSGHMPEEIRRMERRLLDAVPRHFATEEKTVLASLGRACPESKIFCKAMKRQHANLQRSLEKFRQLTSAMEFTPDPKVALGHIQQYGLHFTRQLVQHMNSEEKKIAEFLA